MDALPLLIPDLGISSFGPSLGVIRHEKIRGWVGVFPYFRLASEEHFRLAPDQIKTYIFPASPHKITPGSQNQKAIFSIILHKDPFYSDGVRFSIIYSFWWKLSRRLTKNLFRKKWPNGPEDLFPCWLPYQITVSSKVMEAIWVWHACLSIITMTQVHMLLLTERRVWSVKDAWNLISYLFVITAWKIRKAVNG